MRYKKTEINIDRPVGRPRKDGRINGKLIKRIHKKKKKD